MDAVELKWNLDGREIAADVVIEAAGRRLVGPAIGDEDDHLVDVRRVGARWVMATGGVERDCDGAPVPLGPYVITAAVIELPTPPPESVFERFQRLAPSLVTMAAALAFAILVGSLAPPVVTEILTPPARWVSFITSFDLPTPEIVARDEVLRVCRAWGPNTTLPLQGEGEPRLLGCGELLAREHADGPITEEETVKWTDVELKPARSL